MWQRDSFENFLTRSRLATVAVGAESTAGASVVGHVLVARMVAVADDDRGHIGDGARDRRFGVGERLDLKTCELERLLCAVSSTSTAPTKFGTQSSFAVVFPCRWANVVYKSNGKIGLT
jgi:hypothetical protein